MRPRIEGLEERALLSDLSLSLTTDKPVYQPGQPIQFTLTETNTSDHPVKTDDGPSVDGFLVTENGSLIWQSNAGVNPMFIRLVTLQPGESFKLKSTWNGVPNQGPSSVLAGGTFTVTNQADRSGHSATFQIVSPLSYGLSVDRTDYHVGQPIQITFTETNASTVPITIADSDGKFTVTNLDTGAQVFTATVAATAPIVTLEPGQSLTKSVTWSDDSPSAPSGRYSAYFANGSQGGGAAFDIASPSPTAPLVLTLATSQSTYQIGNRVSFTLTLTNLGSQAVALSPLLRTGTFQLSRGSTVIWRSARTKLATRAVQALAPGQRIEIRGIWKGKPIHGGPRTLEPGVYQLEGLAGAYAASATIRLIAPSTR